MHIRESRSDRITKAVCYVFVGLFALACLLPLLPAEDLDALCRALGL